MCVRVGIIRPCVWTVIQLSLAFIKRSGSSKCRPDCQSRVDPEMPLAVEVQNKFGFFCEVLQSIGWLYKFFTILLALSLLYLRSLQYCVEVFVGIVHEITV